MPRPRGQRAYRNLAESFNAPRPGAQCALCNQPIQYGLRARHALGPSLDHIIPISKGGSLLNPLNMRLVHYGCNASRQNTYTAFNTTTVSNASRQW